MIPQTHEAGAPRRVLDVATILDQDRLRPVDPDKVAQVARSFAEVGQITDIEVRADGDAWMLVAGAHRLAAARSLGWKTISATIFAGSEDQARLREIDENLFRHELNPLDEAVFLAERAEIYRRLHPETGIGKSPKSKNANLASLPKARKFADDVAERTGISSRTVSRALTRFNKLSEAARDVIRGTEIARTGAALDFLCEIDPTHQARVAEQALAGDARAPLAQRLAQAKQAVLRIAAPVPLPPLDRAWTAFGKLSLEEKAIFIGRLQAGGFLKRRGATAEGSEAA
jgi:ParB family transcriptional regulator, chromosome partitioning protein